MCELIHCTEVIALGISVYIQRIIARIKVTLGKIILLENCYDSIIGIEWFDFIHA